MAKRAARRNVPPTVICKNCMTEFTPAIAKNYEYNKRRKFCSDDCKHKAAYEKRVATVAAKKAIKQPVIINTTEPHVNIYRYVHEKACQFAGITNREREGYGSEDT